MMVFMPLRFCQRRVLEPWLFLLEEPSKCESFPSPFEGFSFIILCLFLIFSTCIFNPLKKKKNYSLVLMAKSVAKIQVLEKHL